MIILRAEPNTAVGPTRVTWFSLQATRSKKKIRRLLDLTCVAPVLSAEHFVKVLLPSNSNNETLRLIPTTASPSGFNAFLSLAPLCRVDIADPGCGIQASGIGDDVLQES